MTDERDNVSSFGDAPSAPEGSGEPGIPPVSPVPPVSEGPLPVCDYTTDSEEPCEEPAVQKRWSGIAVVVSAIAGAVVGGVFVAVAVVWALGMIPGTQPLTEADTTAASTQTTSTVSISTSGSASAITEAVAEKVVPQVVSITVRQQSYDPFTGQSYSGDTGSGSGVIIRSDGYILTNYHVIEGADEILVSVGVDEATATVVGTDTSSDLAVLKIPGSGYPAIEPGDSGDLRVGQFVMAVGSPFGLEKTVTEGIVSALNRSSSVEDNQSTNITTYTNLIQTDAAINPGNSGGALVDEQGRLVGINTLIQSTSGSSAGIGFAIPVDFAMDIADQLITTGKATHPFLGVSTETVDRSVAQQFSLPVSSGALVRFVQENSPAAAGGLKSGDIITQIGGRDVSSVEDVFAAIRDHKVGEKVEVNVVRGDTKRTFEVTLGSDGGQ